MDNRMTREGMQDERNLSTLAKATTRRQMIVGAASIFGCLTIGSVDAWSGAADEISHTCEAIHQEVVFKASRKRVYEALTEAKQFNKVVLLSAAMQSGMAPGSEPVEVSPDVGGAFSAFGGYVTGRHIELVPNERIVQAWRAGGWHPGQYSIAKFELTEQGSGTKLVFDHTGFPDGKGQHLAEGWRTNYWEPLEKYFAQG
jgi:uncharacterized protein YndB with AHSA1/START domain